MNNKQIINKKVKSRRAIAMIELIFAIVIIGITLMSVPNLVHQASESGYTTIQQESIAAAASDLSLILSREWDEVGTSDEFHTPILNTTDGTPSLGFPRLGGRSRTFATSLGGADLNASTIANDGDFDDIDDAHAQIAELHLIDGTQDLIDVDINITATVNYVVDASNTGDNWDSNSAPVFNSPFTPTGSPLSNTSNIKLINLKLTSNSPVEELADKEIVFTAFSCNIGSYKLERREF